VIMTSFRDNDDRCNVALAAGERERQGRREMMGDGGDSVWTGTCNLKAKIVDNSVVYVVHSLRLVHQLQPLITMRAIVGS